MTPAGNPNILPSSALFLSSDDSAHFLPSPPTLSPRCSLQPQCENVNDQRTPSSSRWQDRQPTSTSSQILRLSSCYDGWDVLLLSKTLSPVGLLHPRQQGGSPTALGGPSEEMGSGFSFLLPLLKLSNA